MGLMKELNDLNNIYLQMNEGSEEVKEDENTGYVLTRSDRDGNTVAWQNRKKKNVKTGKPLYKYADHLKDEVEYQPSELVQKLVESGRFTKEEIAKIVEVESLGKVDEGYQRNPEKGEEEERKRSKKVPGERTPMPPRGDKRREDFERWYAANVR